MTNWHSFSDNELYGQVGEMPGSQAAYERSIEIMRRREMAQRLVDAKLMEAADTQIAAAKSSEAVAQASIDSASAARDTARWTKISAIAVAISVVFLAASTVVDAWH